MPVLIANRQKAVKLPLPWLRCLAEELLDRLGVADRELSLVLLGDPAMRDLNREWRAKDEPTDVLSFPQEEAKDATKTRRESVLLGDVVISLTTAARQAREAGVSLKEEVTRLLIHGVLHLLGHDHEGSAEEARRMQEREARLLRSLSDHLADAARSPKK